MKKWDCEEIEREKHEKKINEQINHSILFMQQIYIPPEFLLPKVQIKFQIYNFLSPTLQILQ